MTRDEEDFWGPLRAAKSQRERDGLGLQGNAPRTTFDFPAPATGMPVHTGGDTVAEGLAIPAFHTADDSEPAGSEWGGGEDGM
jgi:hypothetical protein